MAHVIVQVNGRPYTMQCPEGEEPHLRDLAELLDSEVQRVKASVGNVGDIRGIASSNAACVLGGVRLISSAKIRLAKIGPGMNSKPRPDSLVCRISDPTISVGIRSGVN